MLYIPKINFSFTKPHISLRLAKWRTLSNFPKIHPLKTACKYNDRKSRKFVIHEFSTLCLSNNTLLTPSVFSLKKHFRFVLCFPIRLTIPLLLAKVNLYQVELLTFSKLSSSLSFQVDSKFLKGVCHARTKALKANYLYREKKNFNYHPLFKKKIKKALKF